MIRQRILFLGIGHKRASLEFIFNSRMAIQGKEARAYQVELFNKALVKNSIVYLGTGAGKTFIAAMMIKEKMAAVLHENKKTVFICHRVPLVTQQAKFFKENTPLTVRSFSGGKFLIRIN